MSDAPTSVRKARHDARNATMATVNEALQDFQTTIAEFFALLHGQPGLTVEQQEQNLRKAADVIATLPTTLPQPQALTDATSDIAARLNVAADFAQSRDFDAHQAAKAAAGEDALPSLSGDGFVTSEDAIGDLLAAAVHPGDGTEV